MSCCPTTSDWQTKSLSLSDMTRSKKIFVFFAVVFALLLMWVVYDISSRTTFPGGSPENPPTEQTPSDTVRSDTSNNRG